MSSLGNFVIRLSPFVIGAGFVGASVFGSSRRSAQKSQRARRRTLWKNGIGIAIVTFLVCWVPFHLPNQESPAGIVVLFGTWIPGGIFLIVAGSSFAGAYSARPETE